jgi:hypothetical protein
VKKRSAFDSLTDEVLPDLFYFLLGLGCVETPWRRRWSGSPRNGLWDHALLVF